jgi:hypothetical protein
MNIDPVLLAIIGELIIVVPLLAYGIYMYFNLKTPKHR